MEFPSGPVAGSLPPNAGNTGVIPGSHLQKAHVSNEDMGQPYIKNE